MSSVTNNRTKKDLKKNDRNPFEKGNKPNPFAVPEKNEKKDKIPTLKKKSISDLMTVRISKNLHSELKKYAQKNGYVLQELYEVAVAEYFDSQIFHIKEFDRNTTTVKVTRDLYIQLIDIKYETQYSQSDILSTAIEHYLKDNEVI